MSRRACGNSSLNTAEAYMPLAIDEMHPVPDMCMQVISKNLAVPQAIRAVIISYLCTVAGNKMIYPSILYSRSSIMVTFYLTHGRIKG